LSPVAILALLAGLFLSGCQYIHPTGYSGSRDLGVESLLWREDLKGKRIAVVVYTNAISDIPEKGVSLPMTGPKSSSAMYLHPDAGRRRAFTILNVLAKLALGIPASPWHRLANGVGWNPETTLEGYPLNLPTNRLNQAIFLGSKAAFESLGATVSRIDAAQTEGISLGQLARANRDSIDYLWAVRHTYQTLSDGSGNARYLGEIRGSLFDTRSRRGLLIFGTQGQKRWIKYRRAVIGPAIPVASWTKIERKGKEPWFRMQFAEDSIVKVLVAIAEQARKDLTDWPNKNKEKHAAQRPGLAAPSK
jgi:hypothetical protein